MEVFADYEPFEKVIRCEAFKPKSNEAVLIGTAKSDFGDCNKADDTFSKGYDASPSSRGLGQPPFTG